MKGHLYIFGTGVHARKVYHCAQAIGWDVVAFVDELPAASAPIDGVPVLDGMHLGAPGGVDAMFIAIGRPDVRQRLMDRMASLGWQLPSLAHPMCWIAPDADVAEGVLVAAGAVVETMTVVERGAIVDIGVLLDHECRIGAFAHLRAGVICGPRTQVPSPL